MTEQPLRVGWIGTGRMGAELVGRALRAGWRVSVYNRTRAKAEPLADLGAEIVDSVADLAGHDVVGATVPSSDDLAAITVGPEGLFARPERVPGIVVDCSTVSMQTSQRVREAAAKVGSTLLAAPISGNPKVVRAGMASLVVSGSRDAYERVEPLLATFGRSVTYAGEGEGARLVKLCHNVLLGVMIQSLAEVTVLAEKGGVPRAAFLEFLNSSVLGSPFTRYKSPALVSLDFTPTFTMPLLRKDLDLGLAEARRLEAGMPLAAATHEIVQAAVGAGHANEDFAALIVEAARAAGVTLAPEDTPVDDGLPNGSR